MNAATMLRPASRGSLTGRGVAPAILAGFAADLAFGDPQRRHPVAGFGQSALWLEARVYAPRRDVGALFTTLLVGGATALGAGLARVHRGGALALCLWAALGGRSLAREASGIGERVGAGELDAARERLPWLCGRDPSALDGDGLCRAVVESLAENTVDAVVAPLFWSLGGAPAVCAHRAANTLDAMVGHHSERYEAFGWGAARLDDGLNWPAARIGAALTVACAPLVGGSARGARAMWVRDGSAHPSPNGGHVEAAFAGALGVRLGGPVRYGTREEARPWLGDGPAPGPRDVRRAVALARLVGGASALLAAGAAALLASAFRTGSRA